MPQMTMEQRLGLAEDLVETDMSFKDLAKKYKCNLSSVTETNRGNVNWIRDIYPDAEFPLRPTPQNIRQELFDKMLIEGKSNEELKEEYNLTDYKVSYYRVEFYKKYKINI